MSRDGRLNSERFPPGDGCRVCHGPLPPRRSSFCSHRCLRDFFIQTDWRLVKEIVLLRDGRKCMECGRRGLDRTTADAHHIVPICCGGAEWDLTNIETLCKACHKAIHRRPR
jgi:5-methylcytosine-specific restriction endonuclease McrA